jgi:hypothetical protein
MTAFRVLSMPALALVLVLTACSGDSSAADDACAAKDELSQAIRKVVDDVRAANLGDARDDLEVVRARAADLRDALSDLAEKQRDRLRPQADQLKDDLEQLRNASSLDDLRAGLASAASSASDLVSRLDADLDCQS